MIAIDTSALIAVVLNEAQAAHCEAALTSDPDLMISAGTLAEALIVANRRGVSDEMAHLIGHLALHVEPVTSSFAWLVGEAHARWGKGMHPAALNFGDCFAYALAKQRDLPLLFIGGDFKRTDLRPAISA